MPQALPPVQQLPCCSGPQTSPAAHTHSQTSTGCFHAHCTVVRTNPSCRCQPCRRRTAVAGCRECRASPDCSVNMKGCLVCLCQHGLGACLHGFVKGQTCRTSRLFASMHACVTMRLNTDAKSMHAFTAVVKVSTPSVILHRGCIDTDANHVCMLFCLRQGCSTLS